MNKLSLELAFTCKTVGSFIYSLFFKLGEQPETAHEGTIIIDHRGNRKHPSPCHRLLLLNIQMLDALNNRHCSAKATLAARCSSARARDVPAAGGRRAIQL